MPKARQSSTRRKQKSKTPAAPPGQPLHPTASKGKPAHPTMSKGQPAQQAFALDGVAIRTASPARRPTKVTAAAVGAAMSGNGEGARAGHVQQELDLGL